MNGLFGFFGQLFIFPCRAGRGQGLTESFPFWFRRLFRFRFSLFFHFPLGMSLAYPELSCLYLLLFLSIYTERRRKEKGPKVARHSFTSV